MITVILLSCVSVIVSAAPAAPVQPNVLPPQLSRGGANQAQRLQPVEASNQKPQAQTPAPLYPSLEQPQPGPPPAAGSPEWPPACSLTATLHLVSIRG
ncbi:MAGE-like protein 2 isoform X1 [Lates japonicus]